MSITCLHSQILISNKPQFLLDTFLPILLPIEYSKELLTIKDECSYAKHNTFVSITKYYLPNEICLSFENRYFMYQPFAELLFIN